MSPTLMETKDTLPCRIECTCGGNKDCYKCYGKGWIDPEDTANPVPWNLPPAKPSQPDTWGKPRPNNTRRSKQPGQVNKIVKVVKKTRETRKNYTITKANKFPADMQKTTASVTKIYKDGSKNDISVTYKPKKKLKRISTVSDNKKPYREKSTLLKRTSKKTGKNKRSAKAIFTSKKKVSRSSGTKCIKCERTFLNISAHSCTLKSSIKSTSKKEKSSAATKQNAGEKDVTKKPRRTIHDKSISRTTTRATKYAAGNVPSSRSVIKRAGS